MSQAPPAPPIGTPFIELQAVDSTNNYARELIHASVLPNRQGPVQHGLAVFAHDQVAGRGQRGRLWESESGKNIAISILIRPETLSLSGQFQLSAAAAVAVREFFERYAVEHTTIKWPNDLYWQDRKAGGILIESVIRTPEAKPGTSAPAIGNMATWEWAIIGIGLNINQTRFPEHLPNPVSLKQITGREFNPADLARELCTCLQHYYSELTTRGFDNILSLYNRHLYKCGKLIKLRKENRVFDARVIGVTAKGKLIVEHALQEALNFQEVEWLISSKP
ncbi:MAG: biotin--[acetyl-CoA-carboxylase] ligase [Chitinophagaceae bacterium]